MRANGDFIAGGEAIATNEPAYLDVMAMHLNASSPGGTYLVSCNLPPRTESGREFCLQSLDWSEYQPTD